MKKPIRVIFAAFLPLHPYFSLPYINETKITHANIDKIVLCIRCLAKISSKKIKPDKRLADRNITPSANILKSNLSIASREGNEAIIPIGLLSCSFFSWSFNIIDWAAERHKIL